jgi:hypothetical protein
MIAISSESGQLLKSIPFRDGKKVGYHPLYGFVSEEVFNERRKNRARHGFKDDAYDFEFSWSMAGSSEMDFVLEKAEKCTVASLSASEKAKAQWSVQADGAKFTLAPVGEIKALPVDFEKPDKDRLSKLTVLLVAMAMGLLFILLPKTHSGDEAPVILEQAIVNIKQEVQKPVEVKSVLDKLPEIKKQADTTKRAINQKLGFLGLLGRKDLKLATGGVPTDLKDVSAGAGPGGKGGSGGELLVGLGQGLKRTTVGNTGVAGLGGVGTKGAGGGAGGYGTSSIGSGEGRALSSVAQSNELVLEGGLDRSVVAATIAKYLSQVRACYETGLKHNPGLGGQVTMAFEIGGQGDLNYSHVQRSNLDDKEVEQCISQRMMSWKFPKPRGGVNVKVSYPFVLRATQS